MRTLVYVLLSSLLTVPIAAGSFDDLKGRGEDESVTVVDDVVSRELGAEVAYHLAYTRWLPDTPNGVVIVHNHGLQGHRGWFFATATDLASRGYTVYAFDRIGSGTSSPGLDMKKGGLVESRGHVRDWRLFTKSLDAMIDLVRLKHEGARVVLWGDGYGAKVVTAWLVEHAGDAASRGVAAAIFTSPGIHVDRQSMPLPVSRASITFGRSLELLPVPMVESSGDNGAHWFAAEGGWFDRIRGDELSLREVTRGLYRETRALDRFIAKRPKGERLPVPTFHLVLRDDPMIDLAATESHVRSRASDGLLKICDARETGSAILFSSAREEAMRDVDAFLARGGRGIEGAAAVGRD